MNPSVLEEKDAAGLTGMVLPLSCLVPAPGENTNKMRPGEYAQLVENIKVLGFVDPVLVRQLEPKGATLEHSRFEIVDGHHRVRAAGEAGLARVHCVITDMSDERARVFRLSLNRLRGEVDLGLAAAELNTLAGAGFTHEELKLTGFSEEEVRALLQAKVEPADDAVLDQAFEPPKPDDAPPKPYLLEVEFDTRAQLAKVKRAIKRAAGKGGKLGDGLLRIVEGA